MSMEPASVSACATAARMLSGSVTSRRTTWALPPSASIAARSSLSRSVRREASTTLAPAAASTVAKREPSPLEAPVTSATLPSRLIDKPMITSCAGAPPAYAGAEGSISKKERPFQKNPCLWVASPGQCRRF
ncbi:hypothetical protein D9M72_544340 [compost metagenome]